MILEGCLGTKEVSRVLLHNVSAAAKAKPATSGLNMRSFISPPQSSACACDLCRHHPVAPFVSGQRLAQDRALVPQGVIPPATQPVRSAAALHRILGNP